jgi:purine-binding chemotaxis protein CheW
LSGRLDWQLVKKRLIVAEEAVENALRPTPERIANVYREHAARLSKIPTSQTDQDREPVMIFRLGGERYSIGLEHLAEVIPLRGVTPVPGTPRHVAGVLNVRGEIRPLMDLKALLEIETAEEWRSGYALLLNKLRLGVGLRVDMVEGAGYFVREESQALDISRFVTCRTANAGMLLSVDALMEAIEGAT